MSASAVLLGTVFAIVVIAAATAAVSARDARVAVIGLLVALLAAPFMAEPIPDLRGVAARLAGATLGAYPLWMIYRGGQETTAGSRGGFVIDATLAVVAALAAASAALGWDVAGQLNASGLGALSAQLGQTGASLEPPFLPAVGAGGALLILAVSPLTFAREPLRLTIGFTLGMLGVTLLEAGLSGPPTPFTDLCVAFVLAAASAGGAVVILASRRTAKPLHESPAWPVLRALPPLRLPGGRGQRRRVAGRPAGQLAVDLAARDAADGEAAAATAAVVSRSGPTPTPVDAAPTGATPEIEPVTPDRAPPAADPAAGEPAAEAIADGPGRDEA